MLNKLTKFCSSSTQKIAVIGCGQMGRGIGIVGALNAQKQVKFFDQNEKIIEQSQKEIVKYLDRSVTKKKLTEEQKYQAMQKISFTVYMEDLKDCDFVIEAVTENFDLKKQIFQKVEKIVTDQTILASNTSSISLTKIAGCLQNPNRFIGMHFFNPVPVMKVVEIIKAIQTDEETVKNTENLARQMNKETVLAEDVPGFVTNRVLMPWINEAIFALQEKIATKEDIDKVMKLGTNVPMGPLTLADFIGLDTCLYIMNVLHQELGNPKFAPCPLLVKYVDAGYFGRKSGRGFYKYN